jgi:hypothetical protein
LRGVHGGTGVNGTTATTTAATATEGYTGRNAGAADRGRNGAKANMLPKLALVCRQIVIAE